MNALILALALFSGVAYGHGLSPSRLESPSGSPLIAYRFTAMNSYKQAEDFDVECFKGDLKHRIECVSLPNNFWVPTNGKRTFKVQIKPDGDGVYLVCTIQNNSTSIIVTRVCARWGVGVSPALPTDGGRKHHIAPSAKLSGRAGSN